jgi:hypothetical protein
MVVGLEQYLIIGGVWTNVVDGDPGGESGRPIVTLAQRFDRRGGAFGSV